jgi:2',5'-phosphodiesterase
MQGFYLNKAGGIAEGCATFVRSSSFRVVHVVPMELKKVLRILPSLEELYAAMPHIQDIIGGKLTTVAQILVLQPVHDAHKGRRLLVANTHLFYYPWANYVRMLQTHVIVRVLEEIKNRLLAGASLPIGYSLHACSVPELVENEQTYEEVLPWVQRGMQEGIPPEEEQQLCSAQSQPDTLIAVGRVEQVSVCFCGDLNSTPGDGSIEYIRSGHLPSEHDNWSSVHQFRWGQNFFKDERAVEEQAAPAGVEDPSPRTRSRAPIDPELSKIMPVLRHGLGLRFASGFPLFTNFTPGFKDVLDYVITDDATLEVVSVAPMPSSEVCSENVGLPSRVFPSDHLSVCVDLRFRAEEQLP